MSNVGLHTFRRAITPTAKPRASQLIFRHGRNYPTIPLIGYAISSIKGGPLFSSPPTCAPDIPRPKASFLQCRSFTHSTVRTAARGGVGGKSKSPFQSLGKNEIRQAFGQNVQLPTGQQILRILHNRRVKGTLIDHGVRIEGAKLPDESLTRALEWLRARYPVDEEAAAQQWAASKVEELEDEYDRQAQEQGLMIGEAGDTEAAKQDVYSQPGNRSVLDEMKIYKAERAREEAEQREKSGEAQLERELQLAKTADADQAREKRAVALAERKKQREEDSYTFKGNDIPQMSNTQRLLPSSLFAVIFVSGLVYYAENYVPPPTASRIWNDIPPSVATITGLGLSMIGVTFLWHIPRMWKFLNLFWTLSPADPRVVSVIGNVFSHHTVKHLFANICFLTLYGISVHEDVGRGNFLAIFLGGGAAGSITSLTYHVIKKNFHVSMGGASGGVASVIFAWMYFNYTNPDGPIAASNTFLTLAKFIGYAFAITQIPLHFVPSIWTRIDVWGHFGGAVFGLLSAAVLKMRARRKSHDQAKHEQPVVK